MNASVSLLSIGDELLKGSIVNSNAADIGRALLAFGVMPRCMLTVPDVERPILEALDYLFARSDIVVSTGGLGPTTDDITMEVVAKYFGLAVEMDFAVRAKIEAYWNSRHLGRPIPENVFKQALKPVGAEVLRNDNGTAPGLAVRSGGKTIFLLPGPPWEAKPILEEQVVPAIRALNPEKLHFEVIPTYGVPESALQELVLKKIGSPHDVQVAYRATMGACELTLSGPDAETMRCHAKTMRDALGASATLSGQTDAVGEIAEFLTKRGWKLATAESCTGGWIAETITARPGVSAFFLGGAVAYANALKMSLLGVNAETLDREGAVSERCAREMAEGACRRLGADAAIAVTGIAGPDGGSPEKPVGLVYIATCLKGETIVTKSQFPGSREIIRRRALIKALDQLRRQCREFAEKA